MEKDAGLSLKSIQVDGGASKNDFLMQFQSDILGAVVTRPACVETTALGAAFLAGLAAGYWESLEEIKKLWAVDALFKPMMEEDKRQALLADWHLAVECALLWGERKK